MTFALLVAAWLSGCDNCEALKSCDTGKGDSSGETADSGEPGETDDPCFMVYETGLSVRINSPNYGASYGEGARVDLDVSVGAFGGYTATWEVDGQVVSSSANGSWTAVGVGEHTVSVTVETTECYATETASVPITVVAPSAAAHTTFSTESGVPITSWYGLSVAPDHTVWGATASGLVHFDPATATTRVYTNTDGLYTAYPRAVLAHSDGTIWVGHVGDTTRQGEHVQVEADGSLTVLTLIDYTSSEEISAIYRLAEQPHGAGAGDVWMGTNEGGCLYDADLGVFLEHAHPTHPHGNYQGVAFGTDDNVWLADQYQLSRWDYSDDGSLDSVNDLAEYWIPWPVAIGEPVDMTDADFDPVDPAGDDVEGTLWLSSSLYGVARVTISASLGASVTENLGPPFPAAAQAIRADGAGGVWIGATDGLYVVDTATDTVTVHTSDWLPTSNVQQITIDHGTIPPTAWLATPYGLVEVVGVPE